MTITDSTIADSPIIDPPAPTVDRSASSVVADEANKTPATAGRIALIVTVATVIHQNLLFASTPELPEGLEIAGYVMATTMAAIIAQFIVIGLAFAKSRLLSPAMFTTFGLGLIAQAACPIDGHVSATAPAFIFQVVTWLAYGLLAVWVLGNSRQSA